MKKRCPWVGTDPLNIRYHDTEWGVPQHDDRLLFEHLILDSVQAGLSWLIILKKRENFRKAFSNFDPLKIANYGPRKIQALLANKGIIRNRRKIEAVVQNAKAFLKIQKEFSRFDAYIWQFTAGKTTKNFWKTPDEVPTQTTESIAMSKDLRKRGFQFVGPVICYAFMQAIGMVNDHMVDCFRFDLEME
jgi:DNA-3-methyladenine glycosylase I